MLQVSLRVLLVLFWDRYRYFFILFSIVGNVLIVVFSFSVLSSRIVETKKDQHRTGHSTGSPVFCCVRVSFLWLFF